MAAVCQPHRLRRDFGPGDPFSHFVTPVVYVAVIQIDDPGLGQCCNHHVVVDAGLDIRPTIEERKPRPVRRHKPHLGVKDREPVLNGLNRFPQAPFGDLGRVGGAAQVAHDLAVLPLERFGFAAGLFQSMTLFDNLVRQMTRMKRQL